MVLTKKEKTQLKTLDDRLKAAEKAVKDLELKRRDALADVFEAEDDGQDVTKLRKKSGSLKDRLEDSRAKIVHCDSILKDTISDIVGRRVSKVPEDLAEIKKAEHELMLECGRNLARVNHILAVLGPDFTSQRERLEKLWSDHFAVEMDPSSRVIRDAYGAAESKEIRDVHSEKQVLKQLKGSPASAIIRLYSRTIRDAH